MGKLVLIKSAGEYYIQFSSVQFYSAFQKSTNVDIALVIHKTIIQKKSIKPGNSIQIIIIINIQ